MAEFVYRVEIGFTLDFEQYDPAPDVAAIYREQPPGTEFVTFALADNQEALSHVLMANALGPLLRYMSSLPGLGLVTIHSEVERVEMPDD